LLALVVICVGGWLLVSKLTTVPYGIYVDGKQVAVVESLGTAKRVLNEVRLGRAGNAPSGSVQFVQSVSLKEASRKSELLDLPEAKKVLEQATSVEAHAYAILANDEPVVALSDRGDAFKTLERVKEHYEAMVNDLKAESQFKERVAVQERYVSLGLLQPSVDDAAKFLTSSVEPPTICTISAGDRGSKIAVQYHVSLEELKNLNPGQNLNRLREGDQLVVRPSRLPITVVTKNLVEKTVSVAPPSDVRRHSRLKNGTRQMRVELIYENGRQVDEQILSQITNWNRPKIRSGYGDDDGDSGERVYRHHRRYRHYRHKPTHAADAEEPGAAGEESPAQ
jgi:LysM repeat protein